MNLKNFTLLIFFASLSAFAILVGSKRMVAQHGKVEQPRAIPTEGRIEIFNGCGTAGAANVVADFLRAKGFDVKNIQNAEQWNYPATLVISRCVDMSMARKVGEALHTNRVIMLRNNEDLYDVTVFVGPDYGALIR